jgi:hypothetical protein
LIVEGSLSFDLKSRTDPKPCFKMDYVTVSNRHFSEKFEDMTEATSKDEHRPLKRGCMLKRYTDGLEHSWVVKFLQDLRGRWQGQETSLDQLDTFMNADSTNTSFFLEDIEDSRACSWRDKEKSYLMAHFIYPSGEDWDLRKDLFYTVTQLLDDTFPTLSSRSEVTESAINDLSRGKAKSSLPSLDEASSEDEIAGVEADIVHLLLTEFWIASRDLPFTSVPENGANSGRKEQHGGQESVGEKARGVKSFQSAQKRPRLLPRTPESDGEDGDSELENPERRRFRGRGPRMPNEFGCPFFKHDPNKHGGRGGCREYSHRIVGNLLRVSTSGV